MNISDLDMWLSLSGTSENRLAKMVGVSRASIMWWRSGMKIPTETHATALDTAIAQRNEEMMLALALSVNNISPR